MINRIRLCRCYLIHRYYCIYLICFVGPLSADPPVSVQIESGPDHGSLIVSWLPVTITSTGTSNGLLVKGYSVFVNGVRVKQLINPTGYNMLVAVLVQGGGGNIQLSFNEFLADSKFSYIEVYSIKMHLLYSCICLLSYIMNICGYRR